METQQAMKQYRVNWNGETRDLAIPCANVAAELKMTDFPPLQDPWQAIVTAMENPIGCPPLSQSLKPGNKVALLTGDRFTDQMLGSRDGLGLRLLDYLNKLGIRDEDVTCIYAPGSHPSPQWQAMLGPALLNRVHAIRHDCFDEQSLTYLGVTSRCTPVWINKAVIDADFRLAIGEISPNVHGGWCGGGKIILPGVAGWDTIEHNHYGVVKDINTLGLADGNHMRRDMEEGARMAGLDMKVDLLINRKAEIVDVYAGDFVAEHRAALDSRARAIWMTKMEPADIYVLYPGEGFEKHLSSSFFIRIEGAELGTKEDGIIILALSAAGGWAPPANPKDRWLSPAQGYELFQAGTAEIAKQMVRKAVDVRGASILYTARRVLERRKVFLVSDGIQPGEARALGFHYATACFADAMAAALEEKGKAARIATNILADPVTNPPGRPVTWRVMPWREG
ncbi:MAG: lactate racemase domain-containing protein [Chloroflexi bacterium]|nr:lactate racemase domain-containing protein [Chloroflexota bacterium]